MPLIDNYIPVPGAGFSYRGGLPQDVENDINYIHFRRPYLDDHGKPCVTVNTGQWTVEKGQKHPLRRRKRIMDLLNEGYNVPIFTLNATSMRKEEWIQLDAQVQMAYRQRLRLFSDLMERVPVGGFNGMNKLTYEYEAMSDPGEAVVDMDAMTDGNADSPLFKLRSLPLPITHSDFWYSERRLQVSRNSNTPLDKVSGEAAGRRVAEKIERTAIGVDVGVSFGTQTVGYGTHDLTSTVFGLLTYTNRLTNTTLTAPTGANPQAVLADVLDLRQSLYDAKQYGPYMIYHSTDWDEHLDNDYAFTNGTNWASVPSQTLRQRIAQIGSEDGEGKQILGVKRLDFLTPALSNAFTMIVVSMNSTVVQAVNAMDVTTVQWETLGGMRKNFKVMAIQSILCRSDYSGTCGIMHARTP